MDAKAAILGAVDDLAPVLVPVPEWGIPHVHVLVMDGIQRDEFESAWIDASREDPELSFKAFAVSWLLCDAAGNRYAVPADLDAFVHGIQKKNSKATARIFARASRLNGLTKADLDVIEGKCDPEPKADGSGGNGESL